MGTDADFLRRAFLAGKRLDFSQRVSVLKFPSAWWKTYSLQSDFPQKRYFASMKQNAESCHQELLKEIAIEHSKFFYPALPVRELVKSAVDTLGFNLVENLGRERWPLSAVLKARFQRMRKRVRPLRGL